MRLPTLYPIADHDTARQSGWELPRLAQAYFAGGARLLQVRAPSVASATLLAWCDEIVEEARAYGARVIVNDRADVAAMAGAAGVHLGQRDLPVAAAREIVGPDALIGLSTHTDDQIERALGEGVDYLAVGPVYTTVTKATGYSAVGLRLVAEAARRAGDRPVVAIGGISLDRVSEVVRAGAASLAVISDLLVGGEPQRRVVDYLEALRSVK